LRGFTLIELIVAIAIVAILAAIAIPAYTSHVQKSRRADAKAELSLLAQAMERCYTAQNRYDHASCPQPGDIGRDTERYRIRVSAVTATTFSLTAAPTGGQTSDACGTLGLDQTGAAFPSSPNYCWQ
jgi:type IV pilus assembly protein PilE